MLSFINVFTIMFLIGSIASLCLVIIVYEIASLTYDITHKEENKRIYQEIKELEKQIKKSKIDKHNSQAIKYFLLQDLKNYCKNNDLKINFGEKYFKNNPDAAGIIEYFIFNHNPVFLDICIREEDEWYNDYLVYTLAHEIGHFISIKNHRDNTEEGANYEARVLCESFLTQEDLNNRYMEIELECMLMKKELMEKFKHIKNM